jgi:hypothetical protein
MGRFIKEEPELPPKSQEANTKQPFLQLPTNGLSFRNEKNKMASSAIFMKNS